MKERKVWFVKIEVPLALMDSIKEGSIDLADSTIDLADIEDAYNEDLDKDASRDQEAAEPDINEPGEPTQAGPL